MMKTRIICWDKVLFALLQDFGYKTDMWHKPISAVSFSSTFEGPVWGWYGTRNAAHFATSNRS